MDARERVSRISRHVPSVALRVLTKVTHVTRSSEVALENSSKAAESGFSAAHFLKKIAAMWATYPRFRCVLQFCEQFSSIPLALGPVNNSESRRFCEQFSEQF